jgi:hypothetical protein
MSHYASYGQLDSQRSIDGDFFFKGIDMKHDRGALEQGMVAKSINKRLRTGVAATRAGTRTPANFNPAYVNGLVGSVVYSNPNGPEQLLVGEGGRNFVWALQDGVAPRQVPITGGGAPLAVNFKIWFVQAFDKVLLLRAGGTPLEWDGLNYTVGFKPIVKFDPADTSTLLIPNVPYGIAFQNRILYSDGGDHILMSDVLDYTSYDPVLADFRINAGEGDKIVCMHPYSKESILVFMKRSVHRFSNFTIDPNLASQEIVTDELGAIGREAAVQVGADVIFLSRAGFYRVNQVFENQTVSAPVPISDLISPLLEGINWEQIEYLGFVSLAMLGDYCHMAVPIGRNFPRNVLLYNTVTSHWESVDGWEDTSVFIQQLRVTIVDGERRLFGINMVNHKIYLLYEGISDNTPNPLAVDDILETRGYGLTNQSGQTAGQGTWKRFDRLSLSIRTRNPLAIISALTDGYNEEKFLGSTTISKSISKFYPFLHKRFDPATDDPNEPLREDYYQGETEWIGTEFADLLPGPIDLLPAVEAEMFGGPTQETIERRAIRLLGRWCSIRVQNINGACDIIGCSIESEERRRSLRVA